MRRVVPLVAAAALSAAGTARAQSLADSVLRTEGTECDENAIPIAGTSGFANARDALSTTAQTYSAAAYAERHVLPTERLEQGGAASVEFFQMVKAAQIPTYESRAVSDGSRNCPANYRVGMRPVDLQAMALGGSFQSNGFGGFYAASVAYGNPAMPNNWVRGMMLMAQPIYAMSTLFVAPLARNGFSTQQGASAFALDWVAGATYTTSLVGLRAGYAGSRGLYANIAEAKLGLFASGLLGGGGPDRRGGLLGFFRGGLDRADLDRLLEGAGLTSLYVRDLPFGMQPATDAVAGDGLLGDAGRLRTTHFKQQNIAHHVDIEATMASRPVRSLYDATLAVHSADFVDGRDGSRTDARARFMVKGGLVTLPAQATLGLEGGRYVTGRVEAGFGGQSDDVDGTVGMALLINDPELLSLYPYAVNAVTYRIQDQGKF